MIVDTHCHIFSEYYENIPNLMKKIEDNNIKFVINNSCNYETSLEVLNLSNKYENMYCVMGLHPEEDFTEYVKIENLIFDSLSNNKFIGIGEIGLDYYHNKKNKEEQKKYFIKQLYLAQEYNLPVVIHSRDATGDIIDILKKYSLKGIIHCFNGSVETAKEFIKLGYKLGINGVITFNNCKLIEVLKIIGVDNIVFETDSPYLSPNPYRGLKNDSSRLNNIIDYVSKELAINRDELIDISYKNVLDVFDI